MAIYAMAVDQSKEAPTTLSRLRIWLDAADRLAVIKGESLVSADKANELLGAVAEQIGRLAEELLVETVPMPWGLFPELE